MYYNFNLTLLLLLKYLLSSGFSEYNLGLDDHKIAHLLA